MFNYTSTIGGFRPSKVLNGTNITDSDSYKTLSCGKFFPPSFPKIPQTRPPNQTMWILFIGVDPADPNRILIRKLVMLNEGSYAYEESRITKGTEEG